MAHGPSGEQTPVTRSHLLSLRDGRQLGYRQFGDLSRDNAGTIMYLHGFWSSSGEALAMAEVAAEHGATVVALDRPGYGRSTAISVPSARSVAMDAIELLDHLRISRAFVMGVSGGSPYAVTLAAELGDRCRGLMLLVPMLPTPQIAGRGGPFGVLHSGLVVRTRLRMMVAASALLPRDQLLRMGGFPEVDLEALRGNADAAERIKAAAREGRSAMGVEGPYADLHVFVTDPSDLPTSRVSAPAIVWGAGDDTITPPDMAIAYASRLPRGRLHVEPNQGHLSLPFSLGDRLLVEMFEEERRYLKKAAAEGADGAARGAVPEGDGVARAAAAGGAA